MRKTLLVLAAAFLLTSLGVSPSFAQGEAGGTATPAPSAAPPAAAPTPAPYRAPVSDAGGAIKATGLFLEAGIGGYLTTYNGYTGQGQQIGGSFLIGYKLNRLILGLGLEYYHMATYDSQTGGGITVKAHAIINGMIFQPTVQFHILESAPLALFLSAGLHVGFGVWDETDETRDEDTSTALLGFHLGLGMRYFLHPRFCIGVEAGFRGLWSITTYDPDGPGKQTTTSASGAFYGRIGFGAIW